MKPIYVCRGFLDGSICTQTWVIVELHHDVICVHPYEHICMQTGIVQCRTLRNDNLPKNSCVFTNMVES